VGYGERITRNLGRMGLGKARTGSPDFETTQQLAARGIRRYLTNLARRSGQPHSSPRPQGDASARDTKYWLRGVIGHANNRKVFVTQTGHIGIGPNIMRPGDEVVVLYRGCMPFVLRCRPDHHLLVGECYIEDDEIMLGRVSMAASRGTGQSTSTYELR
jgi:hypothetical protein